MITYYRKYLLFHEKISLRKYTIILEKVYLYETIRLENVYLIYIINLENV